jgi:hypothetical protein
MTTLQSQKLHQKVATFLRNGKYNAKCVMNVDLMDFEIKVKGISSNECKEILNLVWNLYKRTDINIIEC